MLGIFPSSRFPHSHQKLDMNDAVRYIVLNMGSVFLEELVYKQTTWNCAAT